MRSRSASGEARPRRHENGSRESTRGVGGRAVIVADAEGMIRHFSAEAEALFGHSPETAVGATLDLLVPERYRDAHWRGLRRPMAQPQIRDLAADLPVLCADGSQRTFAGRLIVLSDGLGVALGAMAIFAPEGSTGVRPFE